MTITTTTTTPLCHVYEFAITVRQPGRFNDDGTWTDGEDTEFTTTFVSRYLNRDTADEEATEAARVWGHNLHRSTEGTKVALGWKVHVRQGVSVTWFDEAETNLVNPDYRFVAIVKL